MRLMREYAANGYAFDLEENEDRIRRAAAPVRDATGAIKAAISVSGAAHYMSDARMRALVEDVRQTADQIGRAWVGKRAPKEKETPARPDNRRLVCMPR